MVTRLDVLCRRYGRPSHGSVYGAVNSGRIQIARLRWA